MVLPILLVDLKEPVVARVSHVVLLEGFALAPERVGQELREQDVLVPNRSLQADHEVKVLAVPALICVTSCDKYSMEMP